MEAVERYTRIIQRHALQTDLISDLIALHTAQSEDIVALSVALENDIPPTSETEPCPPPEMAVHAPSTVPPNVGPSDEETTHLDPVPAKEPGKRAKTDYTAREWAFGPHFLAYMQKEPFKSWPAEEQNAKRDAFVASIPPGAKMNRWGDRFKVFCKVKK